LNGYLLGREFTSWWRCGASISGRCDSCGVRMGTIVLAGVVIAFLLTVPFVNLIAPVIATAFMVHLFEAWRRAEATTVMTSRRGRLPMK